MALLGLDMPTTTTPDDWEPTTPQAQALFDIVFPRWREARHDDRTEACKFHPLIFGLCGKIRDGELDAETVLAAAEAVRLDDDAGKIISRGAALAGLVKFRAAQGARDRTRADAFAKADFDRGRP